MTTPKSDATARLWQYTLTRALVLADKVHTLPALDKLCSQLPREQLYQLADAARRVRESALSFTEDTEHVDE